MSISDDDAQYYARGYAHGGDLANDLKIWIVESPPSRLLSVLAPVLTPDQLKNIVSAARRASGLL